MMELPLVDVNVETVELPLVDVNVETVEHTWPLLTRAVKQADFVALDLVRRTRVDTCGDIYKLLHVLPCSCHV